MSTQVAIDILVDALTAVPEYHNPLNPVYETLNQQLPATSLHSVQALSGPTELGKSKGTLTLQTIRANSDLLHDHADQEQDQTVAIHQVIQSCKTISPTPLRLLPLGF